MGHRTEAGVHDLIVHARTGRRSRNAAPSPSGIPSHPYSSHARPCSLRKRTLGTGATASRSPRRRSASAIGRCCPTNQVLLLGSDVLEHVERIGGVESARRDRTGQDVVDHGLASASPRRSSGSRASSMKTGSKSLAVTEPTSCWTTRVPKASAQPISTTRSFPLSIFATNL